MSPCATLNMTCNYGAMFQSALVEFKVCNDLVDVSTEAEESHSISYLGAYTSVSMKVQFCTVKLFSC